MDGWIDLSECCFCVDHLLMKLIELRECEFHQNILFLSSTSIDHEFELQKARSDRFQLTARSGYTKLPFHIDEFVYSQRFTNHRS